VLIDVFWFALLAVLDILALREIPSIWDGRAIPTLERNLGPFIPYGNAVLRGSVRATPVAIIGFTAIFIGALSGDLFQHLQDSVVVGPILTLFIAATCIAVLCAAMALSILLINWPRAAVPPSLRSQKGAIGEWRASNSRDGSAGPSEKP
jgi:hypothetical protein